MYDGKIGVICFYDTALFCGGYICLSRFQIVEKLQIVVWYVASLDCIQIRATSKPKNIIIIISFFK